MSRDIIYHQQEHEWRTGVFVALLFGLVKKWWETNFLKWPEPYITNSEGLAIFLRSLGFLAAPSSFSNKQECRQVFWGLKTCYIFYLLALYDTSLVFFQNYSVSLVFNICIGKFVCISNRFTSQRFISRGTPGFVWMLIV